MCVCARARARERARVCVCMYVCVRLSLKIVLQNISLLGVEALWPPSIKFAMGVHTGHGRNHLSLSFVSFASFR